MAAPPNTNFANNADQSEQHPEFSDELEKNTGLDHWRRRILTGILATGISLSLLGLVPAIVLAYRHHYWGLIGLDLVVVLAAVTVFFSRYRIDFRIQSAFVVVAMYVVAVAVIRYVGFLSGGPAWLFGVSVVAALLLGYRAAVISLIVNGFTLLVLGWGIHHGLWAKGQPFFPSPEQAAAAWGNFMLLNGIAALSAAILVQGLETSAAGHRRMLRKYLHGKGALRETEARYRLLTETIRDVIWTMDLDLRITFVSPAVETLLGMNPEEILAIPLSELIAPSSLEMASKILKSPLKKQALAEGENFSLTLEIELKHKSGTSVWTEMTISSLIGGDGKVSGLVGVARDITDRLAVQKEKERLQEMLSRSRKMEALGMLAGGVAHDLNNVLSGIVSYPDMLLMDMPADSPLRGPIETIRESGLKAAAIVQDLLTLARRGVVTMQPVDINSMVKDYLDSPEHAKLMSIFPRVTVETHLENGLPPILGSEIHLKKSIMNLVSNAVEAVQHQGKVLIETGTRQLDMSYEGYQHIKPGNYVVLKISDQGAGIPPDDLKHIFEPFFTRKKMGRSGTGLGMAVVWGTIQDHKGFIDVRSRLGQGTVIELYFPVGRNKAGVPSREKPTFELSRLAGDGQKILVVDDMSDQRRLCKIMLEDLGYSVVTADSGQAAVEFLKKEVVDLVILDMIMEQGMDGLDTYKAILEIRPGQKAVIASGFAETGRVRQALELGVKAYLKKPYTVQNLAETVRKALT